MNEKLKRFLTMTVERSPVWLDEHSFAYLRSDEQGTHIWEMNLDTNDGAVCLRNCGCLEFQLNPPPATSSTAPTKVAVNASNSMYWAGTQLLPKPSPIKPTRGISWQAFLPTGRQ